MTGKDELQDKARWVIPGNERLFIDRLRGLSIIRVVLVHLGLSWFYPPYSQFFHNLLPVLFFVSGAVSHFSYLRSLKAGRYLLKRFLSLVGPFYVIGFFSVLIYWLINLQLPELDFEAIVRWLTIVPSSADTPFPMGQVWFIHAMVVVVFISLPLFVISKTSVIPLVLCVIGSLFVAFAHQAYDINGYFYVLGHNLYQGVVNLGFFAFGALYYRKAYWFSFSVLSALALGAFIIVALNIFLLNVDINMANHSYAPDSYYLFASFLAIFLVLLAKPIINGVLNSVSFLDKFVLFFSKHAYSIFIIHSFSVYWLEVQFNLVDVASNVYLALVKVISVFLISSVLAIPTTWLSKKLTNALQNFLLSEGRGSDSIEAEKVRSS
ncbi:MAG: hypothetical protein CME36_12145 [unclassified Hahellaceae]|nr:hypothetical protein [Hahellaceae bacterium]|tara:strand:+ start:12974 stop:14110 length:1137 start_codon:yes stop_codon:yes gene_type:complete